MARAKRAMPPTFTTRSQAGLDQPQAQAEAPPPIGDNNPPPDGPPVFDADEIKAGLKARTGPAAAAALNIAMLSADLPEGMPADADLDAALDKLAVFDVEAGKAHKLIDASRTVEKAPYLAGTRIVDGFYAPWLKNVETQRAAAQQLKHKVAHRAADLRRIEAATAAAAAREGAEKKRQEAEALADRGLNHVADTAAQDAARMEKAADRVERHAEGSLRTASGVSVAVTSAWVGTITDYAALRAACGPLGVYLNDPTLEAAVRAAVKAGARQLPGVSIVEHQTSGAR